MITIGIDFGTTKTMAAWVNPKTGHPETINLGDEHNYIPTTVFLDRGGNMAFGEEADENAPGAPECYARGFKMKLGSNAPALFCITGGKPCMFTARQLTAAFLKHVKTLCEERACFTRVQSAVITRPVDFSPAQVADLRQAAEEAGFTDITLVTEPEAAGYAFCRLSPEHAFSTAALVVDWGGGTLDMALVERSADKVKIRKEYTAGENAMGGEHFDMHLWQYVCTMLAGRGTDISAQPAAVRYAAQVQVRKAKEALSKRVSKELRLSTPTGPTPPINLRRADFEQLVSQDVQKASAMANRLAGQAASRATKPELLLLVGGTSLIPLVRQEMESGTGLPARQWQYTREAVAIGAALWQQNLHSSPSPAQPVAPSVPSAPDPEELYAKGRKASENGGHDEAYGLYSQAAALGHVPAMCELGDCYYYGRGVQENDAKAVEWFRKAAEQSDAEAQYSLGCCYEHGEGVQRDDAKAVEWFRKAAEQGHADARYSLGCCYENGEGVQQDDAMAEQWFYKAVESFRKAAEQGDADAQYSLGYCYENGKGVLQDKTEAVEWFRKAAEQGHADAQYNLGVCYENGQGVPQDYDFAVKWHRKAAEQGHADAQYSLGSCYYGGQGVRQDFTKAVQWYRKAAEQDNASAQFYLGVCYANGQGVGKNMQQASMWYHKAAEQGDADAQFNLAVCYAYGHGVQQNIADAVDWYRLAAEQGLLDAQNNLGTCYQKGRGVQQDYATAVEWYRLAAEQGLPDAQYNLGFCYHYGQGVRQDLTKAVEWYKKAAAQGFEKAQKELRDAGL